MSEVEVLEFFKVVVAPIIITVFTVYIVHYYEIQRARIELNERLIRLLYEKYIDALIDTYSSMSECYKKLHQYVNVPPISIQEHKENVQKYVDIWERTEKKNALLLKSIEKEIDTIRGIFRVVNKEILNKIRNPQYDIKVDWEYFTNSFHNAENKMKGLIPISQLERRLNEINEFSNK